jgi:hypothetical protein
LLLTASLWTHKNQLLADAEVLVGVLPVQPAPVVMSLRSKLVQSCMLFSIQVGTVAVSPKELAQCLQYCRWNLCTPSASYQDLPPPHCTRRFLCDCYCPSWYCSSFLRSSRFFLSVSCFDIQSRIVQESSNPTWKGTRVWLDLSTLGATKWNAYVVFSLSSALRARLSFQYGVGTAAQPD